MGGNGKDRNKNKKKQCVIARVNNAGVNVVAPVLAPGPLGDMRVDQNGQLANRKPTSLEKRRGQQEKIADTIWNTSFAALYLTAFSCFLETWFFKTDVGVTLKMLSLLIFVGRVRPDLL